MLALLVFSCLVLLTASFGSSGGAVGSVQRGVFEVVSPIQDGASRALSPVRNLFGWVGDTWHAKGENKDLRSERNDLRIENAKLQAAKRENAELRKIVGLNAKAGLSDLGLVTARVTAVSPTVFQQQMTINRGSSSGVRRYQAVIGNGGLVGKITFVSGSYAVVTVLTDQSVRAGIRIADSGATGTMRAAQGNPRELEVFNLKSNAVVEPGETIVTRGTDSPDDKLPSLFPADIPIGRVTKVDDPQSDTTLVHVKPFVDARDLSYVQVITKTASPETS